MTADRLVLYYQPTLGAPHLARIRALDALPGVSCQGVQLAAGERTRSFEVDEADRALQVTLSEGVYEELAGRVVIRAALAHLDASRPYAIILDRPADWVQNRIGRAARRRGIKVFMRWAATWEDNPRHAWKEFLKRPLYRGWDGYLVVGERSRAYLRRFGVPESRMHVCGNPVDADRIESAREHTEGGPREHTFLYVGRFLRYKNLPAFARAYVRYRREGGSWGLVLVGFGEEEAAVREALGDAPGVELPGHLQQPALIDRYLGCGALVLPSLAEPWGLVVNEAMHAGMPVLVSTGCGCHPELLEEGVNGLDFDPRSEAAMVAALHSFEALSDAERAAMGERSVERIAPHRPEAWAQVVRGAL